MSKLCGVNCSECGAFVKLGEQLHGRAISYGAPDDPVVCKCGFGKIYTSGQLVDEGGVRLPYQA